MEDAQGRLIMERPLYKYDVKQKYPKAVCKVEKYEQNGKDYFRYVLRAEPSGKVLATDQFAAGRAWRGAWNNLGRDEPHA